MDFMRIVWIVAGVLLLGLLGYFVGNCISSGNGGIIGLIIGAIIGAVLGYVVGRWGEGAVAARRR